jgi:hypothetical protein
MTPVKQSKLYAKDGIHNGDCMAACLASLLDLPLWMVPPFEQMFGRADWRMRIDQWLDRMHCMEMVRLNGHPVELLPEYYIACGPAARGVDHSVIYRKGLMAHDPHPSDGGISIVEWTWHLRPKGYPGVAV